jgi:exodeoxyribonuclease VII large subunit
MSPISIAQLTEHIRTTLENELEPVYWVVGELADFRQAPQGHVYFELVEKEGNQVRAKIRSNLWQFTYRAVAAKFEAVTGTSLKNGMKVLAQVSVNYHPVYGLSVNVKDIDPSFSLGERARMRQETIDRLTREGLIRLNGRFELPPVVQKIAILSSATAAGFGDFVNQIDHNRYGYKVYYRLFNALMQGNEAVTSQLSAIEKIKIAHKNLQFDALIIIRGGGAQLDLDCFDDYRLAAAIANFPVPVFTGIGHERDETVADLVAHTRLKTPTAVAEFLLSGFREFEESLGTVLQRLDRSSRQQLREEENKIHQLELRARSLVKNRISLEGEKINSCHARIFLAAKNQVKIQRSALENLERNLHRSFHSYLQKQYDKLENQEAVLQQLDPTTILKRGYTRTELAGKPIHLTMPKAGDQIETFSQDLKIRSTINQIDEK